MFRKNLKYESKLFGDLNIDILEESPEKSRYENLLTDYDLEVQNFEPTIAAPQSKLCLGHIISRELIKTTTLRTTISDN